MGSFLPPGLCSSFLNESPLFLAEVKDSWHRRLIQELVTINKEREWADMEVPSESFTTENLGFKNLLSFASHKSWLLTDDFLKG